MQRFFRGRGPVSGNRQKKRSLKKKKRLSRKRTTGTKERGKVLKLRRSFGKKKVSNFFDTHTRSPKKNVVLPGLRARGHAAEKKTREGEVEYSDISLT